MRDKEYLVLQELADLIYSLLEKKGLLNDLPKLIELLESKYNNLPQDEVEVVTAVELKEPTRKSVEKWLKREFDNLRFKFKVDPAIIGGMVIRHQDKILDLSIRYKLNKIKKELEYESK